MPLTGDMRSYARIVIDKSPDEALKLAETALSKMKLKPHELDNEKHMIKGKTKANLLRNSWGVGFTILTKNLGDYSVIDVYSNGWGLAGPDAGNLINPFYKKLSELISSRPEMDVSQVMMSQEEIEATINEKRAANNTSESANSVADEIAKLAKLKTDGILSEGEFTKMKNDLIDKM